jgi:hypothetical protein
MLEQLPAGANAAELPSECPREQLPLSAQNLPLRRGSPTGLRVRYFRLDASRCHIRHRCSEAHRPFLRYWRVMLFGRDWRQEKTLSVETIRRAVQDEIDKLQKILALLGAETGHGRALSIEKTAMVEKPKRRWSAAARRKMALAQKARWAKIKAAKK